MTRCMENYLSIPNGSTHGLRFNRSDALIKFKVETLLNKPSRHLVLLLVIYSRVSFKHNFSWQINRLLLHIIQNLHYILTQCISERFSVYVLWSQWQYTFAMQPVSVQCHIWAPVQTSPEPHHYSSVKTPAEGVSGSTISQFKHKTPALWLILL